jgi:hypothetical protein
VFANASRFELAAQKGDFSQIAKEQELALKPVQFYTSPHSKV